MEIRPYKPGDEFAQADIFNDVAASLPGFKPAAAADLRRRWEGPDAQAMLRLYAVDEAARIVAYVTLNANGRLSYPWCLPGHEKAREPLLTEALAAASRRGLERVWTTYRDDWTPVLAFFMAAGFRHECDQINYVADLHDLPVSSRAKNRMFCPMSRDEFRQISQIAGNLFQQTDPFLLAHYYADNDFFSPSSVFAINDTSDGHLRGVGLVISDPRYADPTQIDPRMPCFRLGVFGTESERHKRVKGLVSFLFKDIEDGVALLGEAARRLRAGGLIHAAAQVSSNAGHLVAFYDAYFKRQGSFPILSRDLAASPAEPAVPSAATTG